MARAHHPTSVVYTRGHSWRCTSCRFEKFRTCIHHCRYEQLTALETSCDLPFPPPAPAPDGSRPTVLSLPQWHKVEITQCASISCRPILLHSTHLRSLHVSSRVTARFFLELDKISLSVYIFFQSLLWRKQIVLCKLRRRTCTNGE